jgi:hypothetical protein
VPRGDRTGPMGAGAMSGRAAGHCAGFGIPGHLNAQPGRGFGIGFGRGRGFLGRGFAGGGRGWRHWFHATGLPRWTRYGAYPVPYSEADSGLEKQALENEARVLQTQLDSIKKRLSELETTAE